MTTWRNLLALLLVLTGAILVVSCSDDAFEPKENVPPDTHISYGPQSDWEADTTFYEVEMRWWGSDPDGEVAGFFYRWLPEQEGQETFDLDTAWTFTGFAKKLFFLPVVDEFAEFTFEIKAVDDQGAEDATPASQTFPFFNHPPEGEIRFKDLLPDSTWPVIAFGWNAFDPDGDTTIANHLIWVKGQEDRPLVFDANLDSVLLNPTQLDTFGDVTVFYQTVDNGRAASPPDSFDIHLFQVTGDILLVDDYDRAGNQFLDPDGFYRDVMDGRLGESTYTLLDLQRRPFDTNLRFAAFLEGFEHVVWYSGVRVAFSPNDPATFTQMALADSGLGQHLDRGRSLYMESLNAIGFLGGLSTDFYQEYLGVDTTYINRASGGTSFEFAAGPAPCEIGTAIAVEGTGLPDLPMLCPFVRYAGGMDSPDTTREKHEAELLYKLPKGTLKNQWILVPDTVFVDSLFDEMADTLIAVDTFVTTRDTVEMGFYTGFRHETLEGGKSVILTFPASVHYADDNNDEAVNQLLDWLSVPTR